MVKTMIQLDDISYGIINGILHHCYVYPVDNLKEKSGYTDLGYGELYKKYHVNRENTLETNDIPAIIAGFTILVIELSNNDFYNLINIEKAQAIRFLEILKKVNNGSEPQEYNVTSQDWGYTEI